MSTAGMSSPTSQHAPALPQKRAASPHRHFSWYVPYSKEDIVNRDAKIHKNVLNKAGNRLLEHMQRRAANLSRSEATIESEEEEQILLRIRSRKLNENWQRPVVGYLPHQ